MYVSIKHSITAALLLLVCANIQAQQEVFQPVNLRTKTHIAPGYFGPNALPVIDMTDGRTDSLLRVDIAGDYHRGNYSDHTFSLFAKIKIPLFTRRVNLTVWWNAHEWYFNTTEKQRHSLVSEEFPLNGHATGDIFISTDVQCLYEGRYHPDITCRVGMKTAPSADYEKGRYFDSPAYFLNADIGKTLIRSNRFFRSLRIAGDVGFLCWQTDKGRQNDAVHYGAQIKIDTHMFALAATYAGYSGWEHDGDRPMTLSASLNFHAPVTKKNTTTYLQPYVQYQYGIRDYPYQQIRIGLACSWNILTR